MLFLPLLARVGIIEKLSSPLQFALRARTERGGSLCALLPEKTTPFFVPPLSRVEIIEKPSAFVPLWTCQQQRRGSIEQRLERSASRKAVVPQYYGCKLWHHENEITSALCPRCESAL